MAVYIVEYRSKYLVVIAALGSQLCGIYGRNLKAGVAMPHQSRLLSDTDLIRLHDALFVERQGTTITAAEFGVSAVTMRR
jgi:hypothetical protein